MNIWKDEYLKGHVIYRFNGDVLDFSNFYKLRRYFSSSSCDNRYAKDLGGASRFSTAPNSLDRHVT